MGPQIPLIGHLTPEKGQYAILDSIECPQSSIFFFKFSPVFLLFFCPHGAPLIFLCAKGGARAPSAPP